MLSNRLKDCYNGVVRVFTVVNRFIYFSDVKGEKNPWVKLYIVRKHAPSKLEI